MTKIKIDDKEYDIENLSETAKNALSSLQFTDNEIQKAQARLAILQTARNTYANAVKQELEKNTPKV